MAARPSVSPRHTKEFDLILTWEQHAPDGFSREMFLVNGSSPGPTLEIEQDDWVVVRIHNQSPHDTTVHFHGAFSKKPPDATTVLVCVGRTVWRQLTVCQVSKCTAHLGQMACLG